MLNDCKFIGRLSRDHIKDKTVYKELQGGKSLYSSSVFVDRDIGTNPDGSKIADQIFFTAWNAQAEFLKKFARQGKLLLISGDLRNDKYEDEEGLPKYKTYINVKYIQILQWPDKEGQETYNNGTDTKKQDHISSGTDVRRQDQDHVVPF